MENKEQKFKKILFSQIVKSIVYNVMRSTPNKQMANLTIDSLLQFLAGEVNDQQSFIKAANETIDSITQDYNNGIDGPNGTIKCPHCTEVFSIEYLEDSTICPVCGNDINEVDEEYDFEGDVNHVFDQLGWER